PNDLEVCIVVESFRSLRGVFDKEAFFNDNFTEVSTLSTVREGETASVSLLPKNRGLKENPAYGVTSNFRSDCRRNAAARYDALGLASFACRRDSTRVPVFPDQHGPSCEETYVEDDIVDNPSSISSRSSFRVSSTENSEPENNIDSRSDVSPTRVESKSP